MSDDPLLEPRRSKATFWTRLQEKSLPEAAWLNEQKQLAQMEPAQRRAWLKRLRHGNKFIRQEALRRFYELSPADRRLLTAQAYQQALMQQVILAILCSFTGLVLIVVGAVGGWQWLALNSLFTMVIWAVLAAYLRPNRQRALAKNLLDQTWDARLLPYLLIRQYQNRANNRSELQIFGGRNIRNALVRLLPLAQESDVAEWTGTHWDYLLYYLRYPHDDVEITLLTLNFVARYGNEQALRAVEAMTKKQINLEHATTIGAAREALEANRTVLQYAAEACLPTLRASVALQKQAQTLLRPSGETPSIAQDILLRPASAYAAETPAEQLLRPGSAE